MSTLIIGTRCDDRVVLAADRRELRGYEPMEQPKIRQIEIEVDEVKASVLLAGAVALPPFGTKWHGRYHTA